MIACTTGSLSAVSTLLLTLTGWSWFDFDKIAQFHCLFIFSLPRCSAPNKTADYQKIYSDWWELTKSWRNRCLPKWNSNINAPPKSDPINWTKSRSKKTSIIYELWCARCNQFEKYKLALKTWEKRKGQCSPVPVIPQLASNEVSLNNPIIHFLALKNSSW